MVSDFGGIHKYMRGMDVPPEVRGAGLGADRVIALPNGAVVERLTWLDPEAMAFSYTIIASPLPFDRYVATVKLSDQGDKTGIVWEGNFQADGMSEEDASTMANKIYTGAIKGFKKALEA